MRLESESRGGVLRVRVLLSMQNKSIASGTRTLRYGLFLNITGNLQVREENTVI